MKKIIAVLLSVVMLFSLSVVAFATDSPIAPNVFKVTVINGANAKPIIANYDGSGNLVLEADPAAGDFDSWSIYKADGKTTAVEGVDYKIVSGSLTDEKLVITPLAEIIVCGNYNGVITNPLGQTLIPDGDAEADKEEEPEKDESNKAPQTSDNLAIYVSLIFAALVLAVVAKKKVSE